ncbi:uncharacterized protein [Penaeus vannamei]|uniref:uncharacterized protein n=1 Tax=Penaeus vannamei TaxID=6689 RepID=UPI00387F81D1
MFLPGSLLEIVTSVPVFAKAGELRIRCHETDWLEDPSAVACNCSGVQRCAVACKSFKWQQLQWDSVPPVHCPELHAQVPPRSVLPRLVPLQPGRTIATIIVAGLREVLRESHLLVEENFSFHQRK